MRVLICAGRHYADAKKSRQVLDAYHRLRPVQVLIHGGRVTRTELEQRFLPIMLNASRESILNFRRNGRPVALHGLSRA